MRSRNALHSLVEEIADGLVQGIRNRSSEDVSGKAEAADEIASIVAKEIALEVTQRLPMQASGSPTANHHDQDRLTALENRLEKLAAATGQSSKSDPDNSLPNLKYAKSKYKNVESLLNYIETKEAEGGIKLVIMNFND